jgi:hypothetical protein
MVTYVNAVAGDKSGEDEELVYAGEYLVWVNAFMHRHTTSSMFII